MTNTSTNPMFAKFDQVLGKTTPTTSYGPISSRSDEILAIGKNAETKVPSAGSMISEAAEGGIDKIKQGGSQIMEGNTHKNPIVAGAEGALKIGSGLVSLLSSPLAPLLKPISDMLQNSAEGKENSGLVGDIFKHLNNSPEYQRFAASQAGQTTSRVAEDAADTGNIAGGILGAKGIVDVAPKILDTTRSLVGKGLDIASKTSDSIKDTVSNIVDKTKKNTSDVLKGKPQDEILAIPADQVYKLSPTERKVWFDNEQSKITSQSEETTQKIKDTLKSQADENTKTADDLKTQLATASRDKVIELRPKIIQAMGEQSKIYRNLIDEEMSGKETTPVNTGDLKTFIETKYADNLGQLAAVKDRLGLNDVEETLKKGQLKTIQATEGTKTLGELYNQTKSLKQDISKGASKGSKVFTADDKLTDDAINTLTSFMKTKGVDFSEANKFWSKYAPVRNQLVTEAKPFLQSGTQTKTFANTLSRVAKGTDVNNENFINQVEDLLGEPINDKNKSIVSQMTENEKVSIANKMSAEEKTITNEMEKDKALKKLSDQQFEVERQARLRTVLRRILIVGGGYGIDKVIKKYTGIGI